MCLMRRPEFQLPCKHIFCEFCIKRFGERVGRTTMLVSSCFLCCLKTDGARFKFRPDTKGVNVLGVDGGGIKAVIPLKILELLEERLNRFLPGFPIQNHFDLAFGTSSGTCSFGGVSGSWLIDQAAW